MSDISDEQLVEHILAAGAQAGASEQELLARYQQRIARWCLHVCRDPEEAADTAQEVLIKVHTKLGSFRGESRFSTWLYSIARRTALDRLATQRRREAQLGPADAILDAITAELPPETSAAREQVLERLGQAMRQDLTPMEARVVYLHYVDGLTLPAITKLLGLENRSGAKAHMVGGMRKLRKYFGPWLARQEGR